jgi:WD40 repeat protein
MDFQSGERRLTLVGHHGKVEGACWSEDGSKLATVRFDGTCMVWDSSTGALLRTIQMATPIKTVSWGRDWVRDTQRGVAFAMGYHPRLGADSRVLALDTGVVRMILDRV